MPFADEFRAKRAAWNGSGPGGWGHILSGLGGFAFMWVVHLYLVTQGWWPSLLGVVFIPVGGVLVVRGWVRSTLQLAAGIVIGFVALWLPFVIQNARG